MRAESTKEAMERFIFPLMVKARFSAIEYKLPKLKDRKMKRLPSIKTLSRVFADPEQARKILVMTMAELSELPAGRARIAECYHAPKTYDVRLTCLNAIDSGLHGVEALESVAGEYIDYLNTGDTYKPTIIYWRGAYRVQSLGDFVVVMARQGIRFI